uniref:SDR family oxidoreductase n=1 Tax=Alterirhizorhabdus profundi TaxID=2681549 RepID=UPI0012E78F60|nr:SDR family oxidoreductase [Sphingomonas profundi]
MTTKSIALVTGANKGIGREIARQLGAMGHMVWLGCRDEERGRKAEAELRAEGHDIRFVQLDIADDESVQAAFSTVEAQSAHLDVLVNNAGIGGGLDTQPSTEAVADVQAMFDVNFFGTVRATQAFLPLVRKSTAGRIVMISSGLGSITLTADMKSPTWTLAAMGYSASKTALNMFTVKLAKELLAEGVKVNAACPGSVATDMGGPMAPRSVEQGAAIAIRLATLGWMGPTGGFYHDGDGPKIEAYGW